MFPLVISISVFVALAVSILSVPVSTASGIPSLRDTSARCKWLILPYLT